MININNNKYRVIIGCESFYQCHIQCAPLKGMHPSSHHGENITYNTHESYTSQYSNSAVLLPLEKQNKQTNESSLWRMMNNFPSIVHYFMPDFQILQGQTQALELNSVYSGGKCKCVFLWLQNLHTVYLMLHNDWSEHCFLKRRWTEAHLREFTCAYRETVVLHLCRRSRETEEAEELTEDG